MDQNPVVGVWGDFVFKRAVSSDLTEILAYLRLNFYEEETTGRLAGYDDERRADMDSLVMECMEDNLTLLLHERSSSKIAAVQIMHVDSLEIINRKYRRVVISPKTKMVISFFERLRSVNIFEMYKVSSFADISIISVSPEFRGKGIANELVKRSIALLKAEKFSLVTADFTNPLSKKIGDRLGFKEINKIYHQDFTDENNICIFPNKPLPDEMASLGVLEL